MIEEAGSRLAEVFHSYGYSVGVVNTSSQDLKYIGVPDERKLFLKVL